MIKTTSILIIFGFMVLSCTSANPLDTENSKSNLVYFKRINQKNTTRFITNKDSVLSYSIPIIDYDYDLILNEYINDTNKKISLISRSKHKSLIDSVLLTSESIFKSAFIKEIDDNENKIIVFIDRINRLRKNQEAFEINQNGNILETGKGDSDIPVFENLHENEYHQFEEKEVYSCSLSIRDGIEKGTFAFKFSLQSPNDCVTHYEKWNQPINEPVIPLDDLKKSYLKITASEIEIVLDKYDTGCDNETLDFKKTYHR